MKLKFALLAASVALAFTSAAQAEISVSTGGPKGTYHAFFVDVKKVCGDKVDLVEVASKGSDANLENLVNKDADVAFVQTDTLKFKSMNNPSVNEADIQTLIPLYREEVHLITRSTSKTTGGINVFGKNYGGKTVSVKSVDDLAGLKVGAWGGSLTTAQAMNVFGNIGMNIVPFTSASPDADAKAALDAGQIDVILAVGGQPLGFAKTLDTSYHLLDIGASKSSQMSFYVPAKLNYSNMNASGVATIAAQSYLVARNVRNATKRSELATLKQCIADNLDELVDGKGFHPKWKEVQVDAATVWAKFDTGAAAAPRQATPTPQKKR